MTLSKVLNLSKPEFPHLENGNKQNPPREVVLEKNKDKKLRLGPMSEMLIRSGVVFNGLKHLHFQKASQVIWMHSHD